MSVSNLLSISDIRAVNQEQLNGTDAKISCHVTNLMQQLADVRWTMGYDYKLTSGVFPGTFDASSSSQTTTLAVAGVDNIKDTTYTCFVMTTAGAAWQEATVHLKVFSKYPGTCWVYNCNHMWHGSFKQCFVNKNMYPSSQTF